MARTTSYRRAFSETASLLLPERFRDGMKWEPCARATRWLFRGDGRAGQAFEVRVAGLLGLVQVDLIGARVIIPPNLGVTVSEVEGVTVVVAVSYTHLTL